MKIHIFHLSGKYPLSFSSTLQVNYEHAPGRSILPCASERCDVRVLKALVSHGAYVESVDALGVTPMMNAVAG